MNSQALQSIELLQHQAASLLLYQSVLQGEVGQAFLNVLQSLRQQERLGCLSAYGDWFTALAGQHHSWQTYLLQQILQAENPFSQQAQTMELADLPKALVLAARHDLRVLQSLSTCDGRVLGEWVQTVAQLPNPLPVWQLDDAETGPIAPATPTLPLPFQQESDWSNALTAITDYYRQFGVGLFGKYRALRWQAGSLVGIAHPDRLHLDELVGYDWQKAALTKNTEALLSGYRALHVLLYGSRGSGKSSLVKALLQTYGDRGLRLIEVAKAELQHLPVIVEHLRSTPQKFIIFVDDLSFEEDDDAYKALKVVLEGNATARPPNVVVYATSNRRHLIREFFGDRPRPSDADEVNAWDTVQEKLSFSDRFGLTLTFEPADQESYLAIVRHLAAQAAIALPVTELDHQALQWATRHNGRSGRTARQFVDFLQAELGNRA
ncbi:MAG: ATP-binding protein [Leptolyngbyaceae cyanobacterium SL_7_1]|nr:ATP-binding protein [Leptolyngbyaceae cyanobacterium SL_7_1]